MSRKASDTTKFTDVHCPSCKTFIMQIANDVLEYTFTCPGCGERKSQRAKGRLQPKE
jgi:predicted RNA-binding Zn-ribbon protein involved in translation (DUF1610 family)